jgi:prepilin-type N-terminal cleavage/methylation domain-containing protein
MKRRAFTLVELLVATTISALLVVSVVSATHALGGTRRNVERRIDASNQARRALGEIVAALRNVNRNPQMGESVVVGLPGESATSGDRLNLLIHAARPVRRDAIESDQQEVGFFLGKPGGRKQTALLVRRDHALDEHPDDGGLVTVVAEGIVGLDFEYYADDQWYPDWPEEEPRTPLAVRVIVAAIPLEPAHRGEPRPAMFSTVVPLHINRPTPPPQPPTNPQNPNQPRGGPPR